MPRFLRQFGLRTLLIFCTLAAGCFGLWRWHMTWVDQQREFASQIADAGGNVRWKTWGPQWMHKAFGSFYFSEIVAVDLNHKRIEHKHVGLLRQLPTLEELYLAGTDLQGQSLVVLENLPKLRKLALWNTRLKNDALQHVGKLKKLETLDIHRTAMTEEGLVHLRNHPRLKVLRYDMPLGEVGVDHLATIENLELTMLTVHGGSEKTFRQLRDHFEILSLKMHSPENDQWAKYLAGHPTLVALQITDAPVQTDQFADLLSQNTLTTIRLDRVPIDDETLSEVPGAFRLKRLSLHETNVTATGLLTCLGPSATDIQIRDSWLKLSDSNAKREVDWIGSMTGEDLAALVNCRKLTAMTFFSVKFRGEIDFAFLPELKSLQHITIGHQEHYPVMMHLDSLTKLESVVLFPFNNATPDELAELASIKSLEKLALPHSPISDEQLKAICTITQLKQLNIQGANITDEGMKSIVELKSLEELDIAECRKLTDQSLLYVSQLKQLRRLDIAGTNITDQGFKHLHGMPKLFDIQVGGTKHTPEGFRQLYKSLPVSEDHLEEHIP
ncbi:Leucine Rich repeats (2 copies) [Bremerella volcania]|uniref:Leucine Rich repeats (2 copies) n=1 Tax=Bremerella volcania TaxID=2527984 RepID=A0A518C7Q7_9BACT|nr:hypothetical protein [Bremerella volcania]QDU75263.1 Leucine Rich repeats (2 copies) [Bremerella volcania]